MPQCTRCVGVETSTNLSKIGSHTQPNTFFTMRYLLICIDNLFSRWKQMSGGSNAAAHIDLPRPQRSVIYGDSDLPPFSTPLQRRPTHGISAPGRPRRLGQAATFQLATAWCIVDALWMLTVCTWLGVVTHDNLAVRLFSDPEARGLK